MNSGHSATLGRRALNADFDPTLLQHRSLVCRLAHQIAKLASSSEIDDLIKVGMIGLAHAASRFDAPQDEQFENFATTHICGAMLDALILADEKGRLHRSRGSQAVPLLQGLAELPVSREPGSSREKRGSFAPVNLGRQLSAA